MIVLVHEVPGRVRFRAPPIKGNRRSATRLRSQVRALPGVTRASVNPVTGGLIVHHSGDGARESIFRGLAEVAQQPIITISARASVVAPVPARTQPDLADMVAGMLAEQIAERLVRSIVTALT